MSSPDALLANLNPQQAEAVQHHGSPLLIIAGAGSGKTRVITHRIAWLNRVVGIPLWQILAVTFTNKAAREMRERVCRLLGVADDHALSISTFHSRCAAILRREADAAGLKSTFAILDDRDQLTAVKRAMEDLDVSDKKVRPGQAQNVINLAKMKMLTPEECAREFDNGEVPYHLIYARYEELLARNNSLDFEDLILRTVRLLRDHAEVRARWHHKYRYLLVDEFQDTNAGQMELVKLLVGPERNVSVVGDEDQSIYSWRGADVHNLLEFQNTFEGCKLIRLEQNYRSVANVLKAAGTVIEHNTMRIGKTLWTDREDGELLRALVGYDDEEEGRLVAQQIVSLVAIEGIPPDDIAIFYRSHALARPLEDAMLKFRVPYRIVGGMRFYDRAEIKDLLSFMRLAVSPENDLAFERVVNVPTRGIGQKALGDILQCAARHGIPAFDAARRLLAEAAIKGKGRTGLEEFTNAVLHWREIVGTTGPHELLKRILADTRYQTEGIGDPESLDGSARIENIEEFSNVVRQFQEEQPGKNTVDFLEEMALDAQRDDKDGRPRVSLMTVHNAKGLEFRVVFVVGLDQGIFPNSRTFDNPEQFEEERRLFYVALTRARERLFLCRAMRRRQSGYYMPTEPSVYLYELDSSVMAEDDRTRLGLQRLQPNGNARGDRSRDDNDEGETSPRAFGSMASRPAASRSGWSSGATRASGNKRAGFRVGDRVRHPIMGDGVVQEYGGPPGHERVYVVFDDGREQELIVRYASLTKV